MSPTAAKKSAEALKARNRALYVNPRLAELREEFRKLKGERDELSAKLKATRDSGPPTKGPRQRRSYVLQRLEAVQQERATLVAEQKALAVILKKGT